MAVTPQTEEDKERAVLAARGAELRKAGAMREAVRAKQAAAEQVALLPVVPVQHRSAAPCSAYL